jgi:hypothetical protein
MSSGGALLAASVVGGPGTHALPSLVAVATAGQTGPVVDPSGATSGPILLAGVASLLICLFLSPKFIEFLRNREFGQNIREEGPQGHQTKAGTPTMGGIIIFTAIAVPYLLLSPLDWLSLSVFGVSVCCALLGFADDYTKIVRRRSLGLRARTKLLFTVAISVALWWVATHKAGISSTVELRPFDVSVDFGPLFPVFIYLVVAGTTTAVNFTDGLDGLAAGCTAITLLAYIGITFISGQHSLSLLASCLVGACVDLHGRHRLARARGRDRRSGDHDRHGDPADRDRRHLRDRGAVGRRPGVLVSDVPQASVPDGADPPPLRAQGMV